MLSEALFVLLLLFSCWEKLQGVYRAIMIYAYPMASKEEVERNEDNCAICWEPMKEARKLPCEHLFHNSCLCQWVQHEASCPTCRRALAGATPRPPPHDDVLPAPPRPPNHLFHLDVWRRVLATRRDDDEDVVPMPRPRPAPDVTPPAHNRLFHFDGSRYVSWLPSFSVEVRRVRGGGVSAGDASTAAQTDAHVAHVLQVFPQYGEAAVRADLATTHDPAATINNILEGRVPLTQHTQEDNEGAGRVSGESPQGPFLRPMIVEAPTYEAVARPVAPARRASAAPRHLDPSTPVTPLTDTAHTSQAPDTTDRADDSNKRVDCECPEFPESSAEREKRLAQRKQDMVAGARRRYQARTGPKPGT